MTSYSPSDADRAWLLEQVRDRRVQLLDLRLANALVGEGLVRRSADWRFNVASHFDLTEEGAAWLRTRQRSS